MTNITIRDVPEDVHDELAARASRRGQSLQSYVLEMLTELTTKPTTAELLRVARERLVQDGAYLSVEEMLSWRDADRP